MIERYIYIFDGSYYFTVPVDIVDCLFRLSFGLRVCVRSNERWQDLLDARHRSRAGLHILVNFSHGDIPGEIGRPTLNFCKSVSEFYGSHSCGYCCCFFCVLTFRLCVCVRSNERRQDLHDARHSSRAGLHTEGRAGHLPIHRCPSRPRVSVACVVPWGAHMSW